MRVAVVVALAKDGEQVDALAAGDSGIVVLNQTPFYAESGGQQGDRGSLTSANGSYQVMGTKKILGRIFGHEGKLGIGRIESGRYRQRSCRGTTAPGNGTDIIQRPICCMRLSEPRLGIM